MSQTTQESAVLERSPAPSVASSMLQSVDVERDDDGRVTLRITVSPEAVRGAREAAIRDYGRRLRVPGFRPGRIPANIVRRNVGDEAITQKVSDDLVPQAYQAALNESGLQPLERAQVDDLTFDAFEGEAPLTFVARVVTRPEIELPELRDLEIEHPPVEVSDEDVDAGLQALREERATFKDIEGRGAQEGDVLAAELRVFLDGEPHGEMARLRPFLLGQSGFVPPIDEQLVGATLDEERRFPITYPEDFQDAELAGKAAEFSVKVTALKERVLPELNEAFAGQAGVASVDELRAQMREFLRANKLRDARDAMRTQLAQTVTEGARFDAPRAVVEGRYEQRFAQMQEELKERNATFEGYLAESELTPEEFETRGRTEIEEELRRELVLDEIARREEFTVTGDELEQYYLRMASVLNRPVQELVREVDVQGVRASILQRKAVDYLLANAKIVNAPEEPETVAPSATTEGATSEIEAPTTDESEATAEDTAPVEDTSPIEEASSVDGEGTSEAVSTSAIAPDAADVAAAPESGSGGESASSVVEEA